MTTISELFIKSQQDAFGSSQWDFLTREKTASFGEKVLYYKDSIPRDKNNCFNPFIAERSHKISPIFDRKRNDKKMWIKIVFVASLTILGVDTCGEDQLKKSNIGIYGKSYQIMVGVNKQGVNRHPEIMPYCVRTRPVMGAT